MASEKMAIEKLKAMDIAAAAAEREFFDLEEKHPQAVEAIRGLILKHKDKAGYKRLAMILAGVKAFTDHV